MTSITYANGVSTTNTYNDARGWFDRIETVEGATPVPNLIERFTYTRDTAGRILTMAAAPVAEHWTYGYDKLDQLLSAVNSDDATSSRTFTGACPRPDRGPRRQHDDEFRDWGLWLSGAGAGRGAAACAGFGGELDLRRSLPPT